MAEPREYSREKDETDLEFLRYKTQGASQASNTWKIPVAVVILAVAGFVGYRLYNGWSILPGLATPASVTTSSVQPTTAEPSPPAATDVANTAAAAAATASKPHALANKSKTAVPLRSETGAAVTSAAQRSRESVTSAPNTGNSVPVGGGAELAQAQRYLSPASRNSAEAAKWLWKSVSKENPKAVLLLSDLYAKGDGVPKSCDQARLLLIVAARKGQTEAASRLQGFDAGGCQ
jgi:TPR repeat protein